MKDPLTRRQRARIPEWVERWTQIGLSTAPADRPQFERAITACYKFINLPPPTIVWVGSPLVACIAGPIAEGVIATLNSAVSTATNSTVYGAVDRAIRNAVIDAVQDAVNTAVYDPVDSAIRGVVRPEVYRAAGTAVGNAVDSSVGRAVLSAPDSVVDSAVSNTVDSIVDSAIDSAVGTEIRDTIISEVDRAVISVLHINEVDSAVHGAIESAMGRTVRDTIISAIGSAIDSDIRITVSEAVNTAVYDPVDSAIRSAVNTAVQSAVVDLKDTWWRYLGGQFWAGWPAFTSFLLDVVGADVSDDIRQREKAMRDLAQSAGWCWPGKHVVVVSDRPEMLKRDDLGRTHSAVGPAVRYRDGWSVYAWHDVIVPADWIERPSEVDPKLALTHRNISERTALCQILGWDKVLKQLKHTVVDADPDPQIGTLISVNLPDSPGTRFLTVRGPGAGGPDAQHVLGVPREMRSAREANAWTYRLSPDTFNILRRT
jgi:hypothetical protein